MPDKLQQCLKMLKHLNKENFQVDYTAGNQGILPIVSGNDRLYKKFIFHNNGTLDYHGSNKEFRQIKSFRDCEQVIKQTNIIPNEIIIDFIFVKLKKICVDYARETVIKRLIDHQLKYDGLEFLIRDAECNLH